MFQDVCDPKNYTVKKLYDILDKCDFGGIADRYL